MKSNNTSVKLSEQGKSFFKKMRVNIIRAGGSEKALELSYADLMEDIVKYFKVDNSSYIKLIDLVAKNV
jgi:hypothetical protein